MKRTKRKVKDGGRAQASLQEAMRKNRRLQAFVASLTVNGGNVAEAENDAGYTDGYGYRLKSRYPEIDALVNDRQRDVVEEVVVEWTQRHRKALARVDELLDSKDDRIVADMAKYTIDRVEGRAMQRLNVEDQRTREDDLASVVYRFALAVQAGKGWSLTRALAYAQANPEQVEAWGKLHIPSFKGGVVGAGHLPGGNGSPPPAEA